MPRSPLSRPLVHVVRLALVIGLARLAWWMLFLGAHDSSLVTWDCAAGGCATNDFPSISPGLGIAALVLAVVLVRPVLQGAAFGSAVAFGAAALLSGWNGAVRDHLETAPAVHTEITVATVIGIIGAVMAVLGGLASLQRSGLPTQLLTGRRSAWARVADVDRTDPAALLATVHFNDRSGTRHAVRTRIPRPAASGPIRALYDPTQPDDPERLRIGVPLRPLSARVRTARAQAIREAVPLPSDVLEHAPGSAVLAGSTATDRGPTRPSPRDAPGVVDQLERLRDLRSTGALTDAEYSAAKAAVLGSTLSIRAAPTS